MISYHTRPAPPRERKREEAKFFTSGFITEHTDTKDYYEIAEALRLYVCACGIFKNGYRAEKNFLFADWIGFDFDSGEMALAQATEEVFTDYIHIIGITMSHQTEPEWRDKFRVLIPLEERITDFKLFRHQIALGMDKWPCDPQCKDAARFFYPCRHIVSINHEGYSWEIDRNVPETPDYAAKAEARVKHGCIPSWVYSAMEIEWAPQTKNNTCFRLGCTLGILGYSAEEITGMILKSATYKGKEAPKKEIFSAVSNGVIQGLKELPQNSKK